MIESPEKRGFMGFGGLGFRGLGFWAWEFGFGFRMGPLLGDYRVSSQNLCKLQTMNPEFQILQPLNF